MQAVGSDIASPSIGAWDATCAGALCWTSTEASGAVRMEQVCELPHLALRAVLASRLCCTRHNAFAMCALMAFADAQGRRHRNVCVPHYAARRHGQNASRMVVASPRELSPEQHCERTRHQQARLNRASKNTVESHVLRKTQWKATCGNWKIILHLVCDFESTCEICESTAVALN